MMRWNGATARLTGTVLSAAALTVAVTALAMGERLPDFLAFLGRVSWRPHAPRLELVTAAPLAVQIHLAGALTALAIGTALMLGVKGSRVHRVLGWTWAAAMAMTAVSSLFLRTLNPGGFSFLHFFAGWTPIALPFALAAARRHDVKRHSKMMTGAYVGGLLVAGVFAFLPGRLMWHVMFG